MIFNEARLKSLLNKYSKRKLTPYLFSYIIDKIRLLFSTVITLVLCRWWYIETGNNCKFYGIPLIRCHPTGSIRIGDNCSFRSSQWSNTIGLNRKCFLSAEKESNIKIGKNCGFSGTIIAASTSITIGDRVLCGANTTIFDTDRHPVDFIARHNCEKADGSPIVLDDDVWLGMNVVVQKGVHIGKGTVVAANSIVTCSLPEDVVVAGQPAKVLKKLY
jgi:acetyltransferase-like isoleucine patch superfamily enzyme